MAMIKTQTPGIYQVRGKKGKVKYQLNDLRAGPGPAFDGRVQVEAQGDEVRDVTRRPWTQK